MSQWGAEGMANEGHMYYEILTHYYTDTDIKDIY
jgi:stage II sporulation protein D